MPVSSRSPYEAQLGTLIHDLHPSLQRYFATIPHGHVGIGSGVFSEVGTPRRWLWPFIALVEGRGVVFAGWEREVPFRVINRTVCRSAVAVREFDLPRGLWTMTDEVVQSPRGGVSDRLGAPATVAVAFDIAVQGGALELTSRRAAFAVGPFRFTFPRPVSPRISLCESYDELTGKQRIELSVTMPLIGRVYGYTGLFTYRIEKDIP